MYLATPIFLSGINSLPRQRQSWPGTSEHTFIGLNRLIASECFSDKHLARRVFSCEAFNFDHATRITGEAMKDDVLRQSDVMPASSQILALIKHFCVKPQYLLGEEKRILQSQAKVCKE